MRLAQVRRLALQAGLAAGTLFCGATETHAQWKRHATTAPHWCPPATVEAPQAQPAPQPAPQPSAEMEPAFAPEQFAALGGDMFAAADSAVGYIDSAVPRSMMRLRYDSAYGNNRPDRAEFFYPKCGCFQQAIGGQNDPSAAGPPLAERNVDYQDVSTYIEVARGRLSGFVEVPVRFLNPENNRNEEGLGDITTGLKYALIMDPDMVLSTQLRIYTPTGEGDNGLGTEHVSLEPGILYFNRLSDRLTLEAEFKDWISVGGSDFAGNVLRYGIGLGYDAYRRCSLRLTPVAEIVGWTVLDGMVFDGFNRVLDASGDTIVNAKGGVRISSGEHSSLYLGYGRALTGEVWYKDVIRLEYRYAF